MEPSAKIIEDSISPNGDRLTTMEVVMHRFVLAEFNTHRVFSRNSASSRAIPVKKMLERVKEDPALPLAQPEIQAVAYAMQGALDLNSPYSTGFGVLYKRLTAADPPHSSPLEHVATPGTGAGPLEGNFRASTPGGQMTPVEGFDMVNHPPHYGQHPSGVECITITEHFNFNVREIERVQALSMYQPAFFKSSSPFLWSLRHRYLMALPIEGDEH